MRLATVALLLVAVALAVWWFGPRQDPAPPVASGAPDRAQAPREAHAPRSRPADSERVLLTQPAVPPASPDAVWVDVRVVDWITAESVAGADVCWLHAAGRDRVDALPETEKARFRADHELMARTFGRRARTDGDGTARICVDYEYTDVFARCSGRAGATRVATRYLDGPESIEISREHTVLARVVDPAGRPVPGVPVEARFTSSIFGPRETDATGTVRFDYREDRAGRDEHRVPRTSDVTLRIPIPGLRKCSASFPVTAPPAGTLTLELPATGALHVRVSHPGREIERASARLWIGAVDDPDARNDAWQSDADPDGVVRFRTVPLQGSFAVEVEIGDLGLPRTVAGPNRPGQIVEATVEVPAEAIALAGRVVDADGRPVAAAHVWLDCNLPHDRYTLRTDEHGRFLWHPGAVVGEDRELEKLVLSMRHGPLDAVDFGGVGRRTLQPGVNDLGDIRLVRPPLVVAGRFRFEPADAQRPVTIAVERWAEGTEAGGAGSWQTVFEGLHFFQRDGRFVVRGTPPPGRLRLSFGADAMPVEFARGARGLVVETVSKSR